MLHLRQIAASSLRVGSFQLQSQTVRFLSTRVTIDADAEPIKQKIKPFPMVYIEGEEMTKYTMQLVNEKLIAPYVDMSGWEVFDLSCKSRDETNDQVLQDAVNAGKRIGSIFKEPTITPTEVQRQEMGLKNSLCSPNGAMRRGWNGITISRDTIHIEGMDLGYKKPVFFERQAVGGEYAAGWASVGKGKLSTLFDPEDGSPQIVVDSRELTDEESVVVTYDNPLDNVTDLGHHFFSRCLEANIVPYVVTKKTVFKWQEGFWVKMKAVFDQHYKKKFIEAGLLETGELQHLISDAATMQIIKWTEGGFGMAAHNYDGDMLTDEISQVHRSPGFISSNLIGKNDDGTPIKEFEASHGTVADMWHDHLANKETSMNPLGMIEALIGAMKHAAVLQNDTKEIDEFTDNLRKQVHRAMVVGKGTRDLCGPSGLTTEQFIDVVAGGLEGKQINPSVEQEVNAEALKEMFDACDVKKTGQVDFEGFVKGMTKLGI